MGRADSELRMANYGVQKRADAAREDFEGIGKLPPEGLPGRKGIVKVQPASTGEQAPQI